MVRVIQAVDDFIFDAPFGVEWVCQQIEYYTGWNNFTQARVAAVVGLCCKLSAISLHESPAVETWGSTVFATLASLSVIAASFVYARLNVRPGFKHPMRLAFSCVIARVTFVATIVIISAPLLLAASSVSYYLFFSAVSQWFILFAWYVICCTSEPLQRLDKVRYADT